MSDIDKSVLDFDPLLDSKETDIEYIIRTTLAGRDKYSYTAIKKQTDRKAFEVIYGKSAIINQDVFTITGDIDAAFSSDIPILVLFDYDFGGGAIPLLYEIPIFTDVVLTSGNPVTGGTTNYLYATFDPIVGVDGFKLYSSTTAPTLDTQVLLATYTATGAAGSFVLTVTNIYPDGSLIKDFEEGNDGTETSPDSFFGRLGKKLRDGISRINAVIGNITTINSTTGNITTINATTVNATTIPTVNTTTVNSTTIGATTGNITNVNATDISVTNEIETDTIVEKTAGNGISIEEVVLNKKRIIGAVLLQDPGYWASGTTYGTIFAAINDRVPIILLGTPRSYLANGSYGVNTVMYVRRTGATNLTISLFDAGVYSSLAITSGSGTTITSDLYIYM